MANLAVNLGQRLLAAHGQDGVAESHHDPENSEKARQVWILNEPQRFLGEMQIAGHWPGRQRLRMPQQGERSPAQQQYHHHGGYLHYLERLVAGLLNALDVLPPEIKRHQDGDHHCGNVLVHMGGAADEHMSLSTMAAARHQEMKVSITERATTIRTRLLGETG